MTEDVGITLADPEDKMFPPQIFGDRSLQVPEGLPFETWEALGARLLRIERSSQWWIGDWLAFGDHVWGEKYAQGVESTGLDISRLMHYQRTCTAFQPDDRSPTLSYTHHEIAAGLPTKKARMKAISMAERDNWSSRDMAQYVKQQKAIDVDSEEVEEDDGKEKTYSTATISFTVPRADKNTTEGVVEAHKKAILEDLEDRGIEPSKVTASVS